MFIYALLLTGCSLLCGEPTETTETTEEAEQPAQEEAEEEAKADTGKAEEEPAE
jgi:outer membrane biogenesis lipoprotein LolB